MKSIPFAAPAGPPAWTFLGIEPLRAAFEYAGMHWMDKAALPPGDGHGVVIFPGLAGDRHAIGPLKDFCEGLGYAAHDWGRGMNLGPQGDVAVWLDALARHVRALVAAYRRPVSLIGWSLGGIYAREVAKLLGKRVRQVITIGTPVPGSADRPDAAWLHGFAGGPRSLADDPLTARLRTPPSVPTTSIFTRSDGIVDWRACLHEAPADHTEAIEVEGSHCGLGWNPEVFALIADRLGQPVGRWQRHPRSVAG